MTGHILSHYRILDKLGEGGMGVVYKAEDTRLDRTVALKFLAPHLLESEEHKQRFLREAKAAASLDHPNICLVHEVGEWEGRFFLAMGLVDGSELRAKIRERPLKLDDALDIAIQAAEGLRAAHRKGIVHRDIKSSNLMLTSSGQVKIMDFGLAQLTGGTRLTRTETVLGTPAYMSPEQAQRQETDRRTDIWSLGVVLYEIVTGRLPFEGEREAAVVHAIIHEPHEPVTALRAGVPLELDRIVGKALAKDPAERYQHVDDLLVDLRALRGKAVLPAKSAPSLRRWAWAALIPVLLSVGYFAWRAARAPDSAEPLRAVTLTTLPGHEIYPSLSPDGNHVTFTWTGEKQDNPDIYVQQIGVGEPLALTTDPRSDYNPVWSPDGRWIAFLRGESSSLAEGGKRELRLIPPLRGPERKLVDIRPRGIFDNPGFLAWCPDSSCLIVTDSPPGGGAPDALFVVGLETREKRQLTNPRSPAYGDTNPAVSPDGHSLVFRRNWSYAAGELFLLPLGKGVVADGHARQLTLNTLDAAYPMWMRDGKHILFSAGASLWRLGVTSEQPPARLPFVGEDGSMPAVSWPSPGRAPRLVYVRSFIDYNVWRIETSTVGAPSASPPVVAISSTRWDHGPQVSPDGRRIAFQSNRSGEMEIWQADLDGSNAVKLTSMGAPITAHPAWSPDGEAIAFDSNREGQFELYVIPASGGKPRRLTSDRASDHYPSFSRDGQWIYFASNRAQPYQVWKIPASGGEAIQVTRQGGWVALESFNGADVCYTKSAGDTPSPLWCQPTSGGPAVKVLEGVVRRAFAVVERGIYYISQSSGETRLQFFNVATGKSTTVARNLGDVALGLTATRDGRAIFYSRVDSSGADLMLVENFR
jgi:serine/threonine protein kinase